MKASPGRYLAVVSSVRRHRLAALASIPAALAVVCWWLTEPLYSSASTAQPWAVGPVISTRPLPPPEPATWPEGRLEGAPAKRVLLDILLIARKSLEGVEGYTATFRRQERICGKLGPEQTLRMKARPRPFSIYFKVLSPKAGKEVVFVEGMHDGKVIAHNGDWKDKLIPRLRLDPRGTIALADNRHPITEAGLFKLTDKLIGFRKLDLQDPEAVTILDRVTDPDGRVWLRSIHTHPRRHPERPFARVEVRYDPRTYVPIHIASYDWPEPDRPADPLLLAERYSYDDLDLNATLSDLDFDPANPAYAFSRY